LDWFGVLLQERVSSALLSSGAEVFQFQVRMSSKPSPRRLDIAAFRLIMTSSNASNSQTCEEKTMVSSPLKHEGCVHQEVNCDESMEETTMFEGASTRWTHQNRLARETRSVVAPDLE
jgi:tRNA A37 threonylcarbamoyladenosine synthetase subunit TsaC/SUA5/YrdC